MAWLLPLPDWTLYRVWQVSMRWTPNKVTLLRVCVGFAAVCLFGRGAWANLTALGLTVAAIALDALDGHLARKKKMATPVGAQLDILGDRMIENVYFTYFAVVGMVSLWPGARTPCCARGGGRRWWRRAGAAVCMLR